MSSLCGVPFLECRFVHFYGFCVAIFNIEGMQLAIDNFLKICYNAHVTQVNKSILGKLYLGKRCFLFSLIPNMDKSLCDNNKRFTFSVCLLLGHTFLFLERKHLMKNCINCGAQVSDDTIMCPQCQPQISNQQPQDSSEDSSLSTQDFVLTNEQKNTVTNKPNKAYMCPVIIGICLILIGLLIPIPGGALTTYKYLDGDKTEYSVFDDKYSSIDEYVGGDAYNYIIGASLVAGKISGAMTTKAIFVVSGTLCLCLGITLKMLQKNYTTNERRFNEIKEENL